jgi:NAD(P)-dependent dehydrogenase (short-subunit alcohol dehydrogenase family)
MGKLNGKVAVVTAATSGMALATAKLFVEEGAYVFITGRRQDKLDEAVKLIGKNVTGVQGDASSLADLDRLYETVKREKGKIDILFASAGFGELAKLEEVTEEHFDKTFGLNVRGTLFTVQKALPLFNDNGSIFLNGSIASIKGFPAFGVYSASKAAVRSFARTWLLELKERRIRVNVLSPGTIDTPILDPLGAEAKEFFKSRSHAARWDAQRRSRPSPCSSPPAIPASSMESGSSLTAEQHRSNCNISCSRSPGMRFARWNFAASRDAAFAFELAISHSARPAALRFRESEVSRCDTTGSRVRLDAAGVPCNLALDEVQDAALISPDFEAPICRPRP